MDPSMAWRVRTFGGFAAERGGLRHGRFRTQHAAVLLAYLALRPDVHHSREVLADLLWPETEPRVARARLSSALADLRRTLEADGPPVFTGGRESVGIRPGMLTADAAEFNRRLRQAKGASRERRRELLKEARDLAARGEFLPGFYFEWVYEQAAQFAEALDAVRAELETETEPARPAEDPSSLIGRAMEIERLDRMLLDRARCVGILGAGGVGKTRLALDLFERHARRFPGPTAFVRLAEVRHPSDFLSAVARALHLPAHEPETLADAIAATLSVPGLIVLDNLEHLLPAIFPPLDRLVRACGNATFVCTSRRRPGLAGEQILRVPPFRPAHSQDGVEAPAFRLFATRFREAGGHPLSQADLPAVETICQNLGGLPLAIQLAASAAVAVGVEALRTDAQRYLPARSPDATNVHASLGETIEWSLTLLDETTRRTLDALCVLPGTFNLRLIRDLYGEEAAATLPRLHGDSLLEADGQGAMRVLEPIRDHVRARMAGAYRAETEIRLIRRCAALARAFAPRLEGPDQGSASEEAATAWPTMRMAIQLAQEHLLPTEGLAILVGLSRTFYIHATAHEAMALGGPLLALSGIDPHVEAQAHVVLATHSFTLGRHDVAARHSEAGIARAREVGDRGSEARAIVRQALLAVVREDQPETLALANRALTLAREIGDTEAQIMAQLARGRAHALYRKDATEAERQEARIAAESHLAMAAAIARDAQDDFLEALVQFHRSGYAESDLDLYRARLGRTLEIMRKNGWKLREAMARAILVRRLYNAGQSLNVLEELRSLQQVYAERRHWVARAEQVALEAEILFRMDRYEEARNAIDDALAVLSAQTRSTVVEHHLQALIYTALGHPEADSPLLSVVEREGQDEFKTMIAEISRALLEARRGEEAAAFRRLQRFDAATTPTRVQHAYADTLVALADLVAPRLPSLAVAAYRASRPVYRAIKSTTDLRRVRIHLANLAGTRSMRN